MSNSDDFAKIVLRQDFRLDTRFFVYCKILINHSQ